MDKAQNKKYMTIVNLAKKLKTHATDMLIMEKYIMLDPILEGSRSFCIPNIDCYGYKQLLYNLIDSSYHKNFKITKSSLEWIKNDSGYYLQIDNEGDDEPYLIPLISSSNTLQKMENERYSKILECEQCASMDELLTKVLNDDYISLTEEDIELIRQKKICVKDININDKLSTPIILSKPLFGDLKKTHYIKYKSLGIINEQVFESEKVQTILIRFIQEEEYGLICTYVAFLVI